MALNRRKLSVIIPTMEKDADLVEGALSSVAWADEILIVDSSFSSKIKEIAQKWNVNYLARQYVYSADQKNWAIPKPLTIGFCCWIVMRLLLKSSKRQSGKCWVLKR